MQPVTGPQLVPDRRFEAAIDLPRRATVRADVQPLAREMRLQRPLPGNTITAGGAGEHDLPHLRRGPLRPLQLQLERELEHPGRRAQPNTTRLRHESVEPATTIRPDPLIQRAARNPDRPTIRADVIALSERADQPTTLPPGQA